MHPFKQMKKSGLLIREFSSDVSTEDLVWHRDHHDREVKILEGKNWYLQMDNQIPKKLIEGRIYHIPANNYHRLIKGDGRLIVEIKENKGAI